MQKKLKDGVEGENLNLLIGSIPYNDEKVSEKVKLNILNILNRKYGIVEKDFLKFVCNKSFFFSFCKVRSLFFVSHYTTWDVEVIIMLIDAGCDDRYFKRKRVGLCFEQGIRYCTPKTEINCYWYQTSVCVWKHGVLSFCTSIKS